MRVLHVLTSADDFSGGVGTYMTLTAKYLSRHCEVSVACGGERVPELERYARVHYMDLGVFKYRRVVSRFREILASERPDVVHVNGIWEPWLWWMQREAQRSGVPVVISPHGMLEPWIVARHRLKKQIALLLYQRRAIARAEVIHATAPKEVASIAALGYNPRIVMIPNAVDVEEIPVKTDWTPTGMLLFLSRIHVQKGIENMIEAIALLGEGMRGHRLVIVGWGEAEYVASLHALVSEKGLDEVIQFAGSVHGDAKWELYRQADVFVLPTYTENFGLVVAEALASGTPVVCGTGAPWEELRTRDCGWWVDNDPAMLAATLQEVFSQEAADLERMGRNGRRLVEEKYSGDGVACAFVGLYEKPLPGKTAF